MSINTYQLMLKRGKLQYRKTFVGTKLQLLIYRFKMRKWEVTVM